MAKITGSRYYDITHCTWFDIKLPQFDIEEVQDYLIKVGYEIVVHSGLAKVENVIMEPGGGVDRTGTFVDEIRERVLAVKPGTTLPERVDAKELDAFDILAVFRNEMKNKLLN